MAETQRRERGATFSRYELNGITETNSEIGRGSYAVVEELDYYGLSCVGKSIHRELYDNATVRAQEEMLERFAVECELLSKVRHPHIVQFLGVYFKEAAQGQRGAPLPVIVMERLHCTLASTIERHGRLPEEISHPILREVATGLAYLHVRPVVHRDLTANNVLLATNMSAKISDLGVAKILDLSPARMVQMTTCPGTPSYMPPEALVTGQATYSTKMDIFSYGNLMTHVLSGEWPVPSQAFRFDTINPSITIPITEVERRENYLRTIGEDHALMPLIRQCLSNNPAIRPDAPEILGSLDERTPQYPSIFTDRVEALQRIGNAMMENYEKQREVEEKRQEVVAKEEHVGQLQRDIEQMQGKIQEKQQQIDQLVFTHRVEVESAQIRVSELTGECESLRTRVRAKEEEVEATEAVARARESEATAKEEQLSAVRQELAAKEEILETKEGEVASKKQEVASVRQELTATREELAAMRSDRDAQKETIAARDSQLRAKDQELASKESVLATKDSTIDKLRSQASTFLLVNPWSKIKWRKCADMPPTRADYHVLRINNTIYTGGGYSKTHTICRYDPAGDKWSTVPRCPVCGFGLAELEGKLVVVGGITDDNTPSGDIYTLEGEEWKKSLPPLPTARMFLTVFRYKAFFIACGGVTSWKDSNHFTPTTAVEVLSTETSQWCDAESLPAAFSAVHMSYTIVDDTCYLIGGYNDRGHSSQSCCVYLPSLIQLATAQAGRQSSPSSSQPPTTSPWRELPECPFKASSALGLGGCFLALGGRPAGSANGSTLVHLYSPITNSWVQVSNAGIPEPRYRAAATQLARGDIILVGGKMNTQISNDLTNTVFIGCLEC